MTAETLGAAYIDIVARTGNVASQVTGGLKTAEAAAQGSGTRMGGHIGDGLEKGTGRGKAAMAGLAGVIVSNSNGALGPLQEVIEKGEGIGEAFEHGRKRAGAALLGIGGAVTGIGALLAGLGSKDEAAQGRLAASIETTGHAFDDYKDEVEKAVRSNEHYGIGAATTMDALNKLTLATHDPEKAMDLLGTAVNVAASKHTDLESAATSVGKVFNGNTKILKEFGIVIPNHTNALKDLEKAHTDVERTATKLTDATQKYHDKLTVFESIAKPTVAQHVALEAAHRKVAEAAEAHKIAQERLIEATERSKEGNVTAEKALQELADVTAGQASASADTFTGKLDAMKTKVEDTAASYGTKFGKALVIIGPALAGVGAAVELVSAAHATMAARAAAAALATDAESVSEGRNVIALAAHKVAAGLSAAASGVLTAAQWALNAALTANPIGIVIVAIAALVAGVVIAYKHSETFRAGVSALWDIIKKSPMGELIRHLGDVRDAIGYVVDKVEALIKALGRIAVPKALRDAAGVLGKVGGSALSHVPGFASGVSNFAGGMAWVGEEGPELVSLPSGADVIPAQRSSELARAGGGGVTIENLNVNAPVASPYAMARATELALQMAL